MIRRAQVVCWERVKTPAGHIFRMSPPIVLDSDTAAKGLEIFDEAITAAEKTLSP